MSEQDKKLAVCICRGCSLGTSLDIEALEKVANEAGADVCHTHDCLCGEAGLGVPRQAVQDGATSMVVAACSGRFFAQTFQFDGCRTERVNLRSSVERAIQMPTPPGS